MVIVYNETGAFRIKRWAWPILELLHYRYWQVWKQEWRGPTSRQRWPQFCITHLIKWWWWPSQPPGAAMTKHFEKDFQFWPDFFIPPNPVIALNTINDFLILPNCCRRLSHPARLNVDPVKACVWRRLISLHDCNPVAGNLRVSLSSIVQSWDKTVPQPGSHTDPIWRHLQSSSGCRRLPNTLRRRGRGGLTPLQTHAAPDPRPPRLRLRLQLAVRICQRR